MKLSTTNHAMGGEMGTCAIAMLRPETCENVALSTALGYDMGGSVSFSVEPLVKGGKPSIVHISGFLMEDDNMPMRVRFGGKSLSN